MANAFVHTYFFSKRSDLCCGPHSATNKCISTSTSSRFSMSIITSFHDKYWSLIIVAFGLYYYLCPHGIILGHMIPNHISMPSRSQARVAQVLKNINKSNQKEISSSAKARTKYVQSEKETHYKPLPLSIKQSGAPILQLFARRSGAGHWTMFLERLIEKEFCEMSTQYFEGGTSAEIVRSEIECYVAQQVFGKGLGDPPMIDEVRKVLPHFSKLKPRLFEFGFKIFSVDESGPVNTLSRGMAKLSIDREDFNVLLQEPADIIDIESIVKRAEDRQQQTLPYALQGQISSFVAKIDSSNITEVFISSDGSVWMRGNRCMDASAGIVFLSPSFSAQQEPDTLNYGSEGGDDDGQDSNSNSFFTGFQTDTTNQESEAELLKSSSDCMLMLRVDDAGGMVSTPFDAELLAFLAAITVARVIADALTAATRTVDGEERHSDNGESLPPRPPVRFVLRTDSRSLCKAVRSRRLSVAAVAETEMEVSAAAQANKRCLWELVMKHVDQTNLTGSSHVHSKPLKYSCCFFYDCLLLIW